MPAQRIIDIHSSGGGFCVICGTVWPCAQAGKQTTDEKVLVTSSR
ncbi:hypothetical protein [Kineosporia corallincola]|nr:hypothetical protein [Kineosporia corallincola]